MWPVWSKMDENMNELACQSVRMLDTFLNGLRTKIFTAKVLKENEVIKKSVAWLHSPHPHIFASSKRCLYNIYHKRIHGRTRTDLTPPHRWPATFIPCISAFDKNENAEPELYWKSKQNPIRTITADAENNHYDGDVHGGWSRDAMHRCVLVATAYRLFYCYPLHVCGALMLCKCVGVCQSGRGRQVNDKRE